MNVNYLPVPPTPSTKSMVGTVWGVGQQLTVHQGNVQASAHVVFHRTHDPEEEEEKQNTTVGPKCGTNTLLL